jgi:uncharacterized protein (TIGR02001 family)
MRKTLAAAAIASAFVAAPGVALADEAPANTLSANVGFTSNYIFRGISQTGGNPAIQGGFDYAHSSGFYLGTWASNVSWLEDFGLYNRSSLEWDFYGGFTHAIGDTDFVFDVGTIYYYYPGNQNFAAPNADTWELYAALKWKFLGVKYSYALNDYFAQQPTGQKNDGTYYLDFFLSYPIADTGISIDAHYGILDVRNDGDSFNATKASYNDWKLGVSYTVPKTDIASNIFEGINLGVYYTDTDIDNSITGTNWYTDLNGYDTSKGTWVVFLKKTF